MPSTKLFARKARNYFSVIRVPILVDVNYKLFPEYLLQLLINFFHRYFWLIFGFYRLLGQN